MTYFSNTAVVEDLSAGCIQYSTVNKDQITLFPTLLCRDLIILYLLDRYMYTILNWSANIALNLIVRTLFIIGDY